MAYVDGEIDADILYFKSYLLILNHQLLKETDENQFDYAELKKELRQNNEAIEKRDLKLNNKK